MIFLLKRNFRFFKFDVRPNVIFVLMESMSASFMSEFGNEKKITPFLDSIANQGMFLEIYKLLEIKR